MPVPVSSASANQSGTGWRMRCRGTRAHPRQPAEPAHDAGERHELRRVGRLHALEGFGVGVAVGPGAVDPQLTNRHDGAGGIGNVVGVVDDPPVALERVEHPVAGALVDERRPGVRIVFQRPEPSEQQRGDHGAGVPEVVDRGIGERHAGHVDQQPSSGVGVRSADHESESLSAPPDPRPNDFTASSSEVRWPSSSAARDDEREVTEVVAQLLECGEPLDSHDRRHRLPVSGDDHLAAVGCVGNEAGDATAAGRGDAQVLQFGWHPQRLAPELCRILHRLSREP